MSLAIFCYDKKFLGHDIFFFFGSCRLLSCFSQHRIICCDTMALAILKSSSIAVATEFYHSLASIVVTRNFFVATKVFPSTLDYVVTRISLLPLFLCCSSASCRDKEFTSFMFCLS